MKIILKIFLMITLVLFLVSCGSGIGKNQIQQNFKTGVGDLKIIFLPNSPPNEIYPDSDFKIVASVENGLAYDLVNGRLSIVGLDDKYFQIYPLDQTFEPLMGRSFINPLGDKIFLEFNGHSQQLFQHASYYTANFLLKVIFSSHIEFSDTICLNANLYDVYDSGCQMQEKKSYHGQGGALAVTSLEQVVSPGYDASVQFRFNVQNKGNGNIKNIYLGQSKLGNKDLNCYFQGEDLLNKKIQLTPSKQETVLICTTPILQKESYETTIVFDLGYDYEVKEQKQIKLVSS